MNGGPVGGDLARAELESILNSGLFAHAPSLAQFLSYVGVKFIAGQAGEIKEYNIAVEALGRKPLEYDQKKDSIVRVEAHRLRKRLRQYYEAEGAGHAVQIVIPAGQYVPQFLFRQEVEHAGEVPVSAGELQPVETLEVNGLVTRQQARSKAYLLWFSGALAVLVVMLIALRLVPGINSPSIAAKADATTISPAIAPDGPDVRILAGSSVPKYVDHLGNIWGEDRFFTGGSVFSTPPSYHIIGTQDPAIFQSRREGVFSYDIPLAKGIYELHLYFAETLFGEGNIAGGGETNRIFDIQANGKPLLQQLDVIADAPGPNTADIKVFRDISPAADGFLHLKFTIGYKEKPILNGIELVPGIVGRIRPIRITARETPVTTKDGRIWEADRYFIGGQRVLRAQPVEGAADPDLYKGERYGNFTYTIPVAPGKYTVTLRFSESWFGPKKPAGGGAGDRVFDVYANGEALLRNLDIFKEAGGDDRPLVKVFHSIPANAAGKLALSFVPVRNYACVNAIEVLDEGIAAR